MPQLLGELAHQYCSVCGQPKSACSIRVSTRVFVRNWRIVRKKNSVKFFVFNNQQWCESHLSLVPLHPFVPIAWLA